MGVGSNHKSRDMNNRQSYFANPGWRVFSASRVMVNKEYFRSFCTEPFPFTEADFQTLRSRIYHFCEQRYGHTGLTRSLTFYPPGQSMQHNCTRLFYSFVQKSARLSPKAYVFFGAQGNSGRRYKGQSNQLPFDRGGLWGERLKIPLE